jgi:hypothetical protein
VRGSSHETDIGRLHVKSRHLRNGRWEDGRETYHVEDPRALVRFRE